MQRGVVVGDPMLHAPPPGNVGGAARQGVGQHRLADPGDLPNHARLRHDAGYLPQPVDVRDTCDEDSHAGQGVVQIGQRGAHPAAEDGARGHLALGVSTDIVGPDEHDDVVGTLPDRLLRLVEQVGAGGPCYRVVVGRQAGTAGEPGQVAEHPGIRSCRPRHLRALGQRPAAVEAAGDRITERSHHARPRRRGKAAGGREQSRDQDGEQAPSRRGNTPHDHLVGPYRPLLKAQTGTGPATAERVSCGH